MIPVLYPSTETAFENNGLGGLPDAISCVVTEQRNTQGGYFLEMEYPIDGLHFDLLAPERIIYAAPSMGNTPQPFRISRINRPINGIVHIEAPHISAELQKLTSWGIDTGTNVQGMIYNQFYRARQLGQTVPFWCETDITVQSDVTFSHPEPTTLADILLGAEGSVLDVVGGEYEFDGYHIILHSQRGTDSGLEIRYGVNMSDIEAETDAAELVTAVVPFWKGTVNDVETVVIGDMCSASNASAYAYVRCVPLDVSQQFEETDTQPTKADVTAKGQAFINSTSRKLLQTSIKVKYEPTTGGIGERLINLCDTVRVVYPDLNVSSISKVVETRFNTLTEQYDELTIGSIRNNIVDTIAGLISGGAITGGGGSSGGGSLVGAVLYNQSMNLNEAEKALARSNIGAAAPGGDLTGVVMQTDMNINGVEHGVVGDGETDDYSAIQTLLDQIAVTISDRNSNGNNSLYLPNRTYLISQPLLISDNVHFKCDGKILYNGAGSAVIVDGRYNFIDIAMISAPNGTGLEMDASRRTHETMSNNIRVGRIRPCVRGIYLHDAEGEHSVTTDYIQCDQIDSGSSSNPGTYGIEVVSTNQWLTEIHFTIGHITNFGTGVYLHGEGEQYGVGGIRFHRVHIEGVTDQAVKMHNVVSCTFENARIDEGYGVHQMVLSGTVNRCEVDLDFLYIDKIDISNLEASRYNVFRARAYFSSDNSRYIGYEYILTDIPGENVPAFIPIGRTVSVTYGADTYGTIYNLYKRGIAVLCNDATNPTVFALGRIDTTNKIAFFASLYPSASSSDGYIQIWKCQEVNGATTWTRASEAKIQAQTDKVTTISASSTDTQYPTAKAVWGLVQSIVLVPRYSNSDNDKSLVVRNGALVWDSPVNYYSVTLNANGTVNTKDSSLSWSTISARMSNESYTDYLLVTWGNSLFTAEAVEMLSNNDIKFIADVEHDGIQRHMVFTLDRDNILTTTAIETYSLRPITVWEVQDVTQGLIALNANISSNLAWQLTGLNLSPFKRIKIYAKAGRKTGTTAQDSSIVPAAIIEMLLDDRAKETVSQNVFIGSAVVQNPNDANRLGMLTCAVSGDKTKFAVLRATSLYGTAATSNTDCYQYVFKIEGYYD